MENNDNRKICKFFSFGKCKFGSECQFRHVKRSERRPQKDKANEKIETQHSKKFQKENEEQKTNVSHKEVSESIPEENKCESSIRFIEFAKTHEGKENYERNKRLWGDEGFIDFIRKHNNNEFARDLCQFIRRFQAEIFFGNLDAHEFEKSKEIFVRFTPNSKAEIKEEIQLPEGQFIFKAEISQELDFQNFNNAILEYNSRGKSVEIINGSFGDELKAKLNPVLDLKLNEFKGKLFPLFKWLDLNSNEFLVLAKREINPQSQHEHLPDPNIPHEEVVKEKDESRFFIEENSSVSSHESDSEETKPKKPKKIVADPQLFSSKVFQCQLSFNVLIKSLNFTNVGVVYISETTLSLTCNHCRKDSSISLFPNEKTPDFLINILPCLNCSTASRAVFHKQAAHKSKELIGSLGIANWKFKDFLFVSLLLTCENCGFDMPLKDAQRSKNHFIQCHSCFKELVVSFESLIIEEKLELPQKNEKQAQNLKGEIEKPKYQKKKIGLFKPGQALPKNGSCKHYKYSFRWFRFPCCGKAYPCDECHFEVEKHEYEKADSMICGYCSSEQRVRSECSKCNQSLTRDGPRTGHWEGGKGCRNALNMSKKDGKKYKGTAKTHAHKGHGN